jgi:plastocyanin
MNIVIAICRSCSWLLILILVFAGCTSAPEKVTYRSYTIEIKQMKFQPAELFVHQYDTVVFVNHDLVIHDITESTSKAWSSSALLIDSSWKLAVSSGADYFCSIHPAMKGKVTMQ